MKRETSFTTICWMVSDILELERKVDEWEDPSGQTRLSAHWEVWAEKV